MGRVAPLNDQFIIENEKGKGVQRDSINAISNNFGMEFGIVYALPIDPGSVDAGINLRIPISLLILGNKYKNGEYSTVELKTDMPLSMRPGYTFYFQIPIDLVSIFLVFLYLRTSFKTLILF